MAEYTAAPLNLSSLDGWWAEAWRPEVGWALGEDQARPREADPEDAEALYQTLETDIAPCFYQRDTEDLPAHWLERVRHSMAQLTIPFSRNRMIQQYLDDYYEPAAQALA